jgi:cell wall-associated NlpC family hydrolase
MTDMARGSLARRLLVAGVFVCVARSVALAGAAKPAPPIEVPDEDVPEAAVAPAASNRSFHRRFATSLVFAMLFFAGAAFTAGAGNELAPDVTSTDVTPAVAVEADVVTDVAPVAPAPVPAEAAPAPADTAPADPTPAPAPTEPAPGPSDATAPPAPTDPTPAPAPPEPATVAAPAYPAPAQAADAADGIVVRLGASTGVPAPLTTVSPTLHAMHRTAHRGHRVAAVVSAPVQVAIGPIPYEAIAFNPQAWLHANVASRTGASAVAIAQHYVGVPYVWGGAVPLTGFDCSGFTQFVYAQLGVSLPHYAASQFAAFPKLDPAELEPGDLVFFEPKFDGPGHVALYLGNDQMIEAPHTGALVRISSFSGAAATMGFLGAVRPYTVVAQALVPRRTVSSGKASAE